MKRKILFSLFFILTFIFCINNKVEASYSASNQTAKSGGSVSITIKSTTELESFDILCTDTGGLTYKSCSSSVTGAVVNSSGKKISYAAIGGQATTLGTYKFTAPEVTKETKYTVKFDVNGTPISSTVTVKATETTNSDTTSNNNNTPTTTTKSSNAYLSTLGVTPKEYDFSGFSKTKTSYSVTVPSTVDSLKVVAKAADSKATVKVSGNSGFEVGSNNTIKVVVTAEDGKTTKTYIIKVTKLAEDEEKPGNVIEDDKGLYLTSLSIEGLELSPKFAKDTYSYTATLSDSSVNEVKINAVANKEKAKIDISGNTNLVEGENTINLVLTLDGSTEQTVYQIVITKEATDLVPTTYGDSTTSSTNDIIGMFKGYVGIAMLVLILMIVAVIVLILLLRKENKKVKEKKTETENNEEYNVYKNDLNEFKNNENIEKENFIESLYYQRNETELDEQDKQTIDEINKQTEEIFKEKQIEGQSVEYGTSKFEDENPLEERQRRRGKHF